MTSLLIFVAYSLIVFQFLKLGGMFIYRFILLLQDPDTKMARSSTLRPQSQFEEVVNSKEGSLNEEGRKKGGQI
jgi:hypothetical protein